MHQHLLRAQAEGLLGLVGQCERLAEAGQLQCVDARVGRDDDRQRLVCDADNVHLGLRLGERERAHLASGAESDVVDAVLGGAQLAPEFEVRANLADLGNQLDAAVDEK